MASSFDPAEIDGRVDARPILYRSEKNAWERTERLRTSLYREMETICEQLGIEALVLQSEPYVHPTWVRFVSWLPVDSQGMTARSAMTVTITTLPYRNYEALYKVEWEKHGQSGSIAQLYALGPTQVRELLIALSAPPTSSSTRTHLHAILKPVQLRQAWWHLWRPTNKIKAVRRDWLRIGSGVSIAFGLIVLLGPTLIGLLFLLAGGIGFISANRRPQIVRSAGKPLAEPRILLVV